MDFLELKNKKKRSLIVLCTLGLAAIPFFRNSESYIFEGTHLDASAGDARFVLKIISFLVLSIPYAVIGFVYHLIRFFYLLYKEKKMYN